MFWNIASRAVDLVRSGQFFGTFQLHFESLRAYLEPVHGLYGGLRGRRVVVRDEAEALREVRLLVYEHLS